MADYYPLIARAIAALDPAASGESRRALYERARAALIAQLRSVQPALSESEIVRERLGLEEAVRKVESETAQRARDASRLGGRSGLSAVDAFRRAKASPPSPVRSFPDITADLSELGRAEAQADKSARASSSVQQKKYPDSLQTRDKLEVQAARAKLERERSAEKENLERRSDIEPAIREQDELRRQREELEAARVQKERSASLARAQLAKVASPAPLLAADGRLDAGANSIYDEPGNSDDLPTLPIRQRAIIKSILSDLPGNSPRYLKTTLQSYDDELKVRGAQPILGLLKDMFEIIAAAVGDPVAQQEWLAPGLQKAFEKVAENHRTLVSHFPLDPEREEVYAQTLVEEGEASGHSLSGPFQQVAQAAQDANRAGLATDDFLKVVDKMAEFATIISTLPHSRPPSATVARDSEFDAHAVVVHREDRIGAIGQPVSAKKRILLSGLGFFERVYNLINSTVTIAATPEGLSFVNQLRESIAALVNFLR